MPVPVPARPPPGRGGALAMTRPHSGRRLPRGRALRPGPLYAAGVQRWRTARTPQAHSSVRADVRRWRRGRGPGPDG